MIIRLTKCGPIIPITVEHCIRLDDIKELILSEQGYNEDGSFKLFKRFKRKREVIKLIKGHLILYGSEIDYGFDDDIRNKFENKSLNNASKLFPELVTEEGVD